MFVLRHQSLWGERRSCGDLWGRDWKFTSTGSQSAQEPILLPKKARQEPTPTALNMFIMNECEKRESDAPAELYRAATGRPQARGAVFAAAKTSAGASPSRSARSIAIISVSHLVYCYSHPNTPSLQNDIRSHECYA